MADSENHNRGEWRQPNRPEGVAQYLQALRDRWWVIVIAILLTTGTALLYVTAAEKVYEAEADVLISPVANDNQLLISLGLTATSGDPLRDVETGARLIASTSVAELASENLQGTDAGDIPPSELLSDVTVAPLAESNIVSVIAQSNSPQTAADIANAFADAAVQERTKEFQGELKQKLAELEQATAGGNPNDPATSLLLSDIAQLRLLKGQDDPTLSVQQPAQPPESAVSPRPKASLIGGALAGLVLGIGAVFAIRLFDPRLRHEEQLQEQFRLPLLARIPRDPSGNTPMPISPGRLSTPTTEAYRTLRENLSVIRPFKKEGGRSILVTSASAQEGKSTTAVGLAAAMADAGNSVILIEADLRRPELPNALGLPPPTKGVVSVLLGRTPIEEALVPAPGIPNLELLLADHTGPSTVELFGLPATEDMIESATAIADFVIVDSAPINEVVDSLPLARIVDNVVICVHLGRTRMQQVAQLAETLDAGGIEPSGFTVIGTETPSSNYYYYPERSIKGGGQRSGPTRTGEPEQDRGSAGRTPR